MAFSPFATLFKHHRSLVPDHFNSPESDPSSSHSLWVTLYSSQQLSVCLLTPWIYLFWTFHVHGMIAYVVFCVWCFWLSLFLFFYFLGLHPWHMEVPRLGVSLELQLLAYTTASATWDLSCICKLHHSSGQCQSLNPVNEARDQTHILMDTSQVYFCCTTTGTPT